jgi:hypothetical protein
MSTREMAKLLLQDVHETLEGTMTGVTDDVANWQPSGKALSVGAAYTHAVISEDMLLATMLAQKPMLIDQGWADKMGLSEPHPAVTESWEQDFAAWTKSVRVEIAKLQEYAKATYAQTEDYLDSLSDDDFMNKKVDLTSWGMGADYPLWRFFHRFIIGHADNLTGEISSVKGLQDLKGYPF